MSRAIVLLLLAGGALVAAMEGAAGTEDAGNVEEGPTGALHKWALMQKGQDAKSNSDPNAPDIEMQSVTGSTGGAEVDLASTGPAESSAATGSAGETSSPVATGTGGTGGEGAAVSSKLRSKLRAFGDRLLDLFASKDGTSSGSVDKFRASAERMMRNMTLDELATGMALDEAEMKELSLLSLDVVAPIACGLIAVPAAGASEPGAKNDPVAEKAAEAEADVMTAEKESADVKYTKQYSAEMKLGGYDGDNFKKAQREAFAKFVSKLTGADLAAVTIDSFGVVTGRRLLKASASGKVKVAFTVQAKTADSATKGVAAINGLDGAAALALAKEAGLAACTGLEVSKKAVVEDTAAKLAADSKVENAKEKASAAQDDAKEVSKAAAPKKGVLAAPKKKAPLKLRPGAGHWVWTLNRDKQWELSGMSRAFWARQKAKMAAKKAAMLSAKEETPAAPAATGATGAADSVPTVVANPL